MDKLDKEIMESKRDYSPSSNFTRETMERINEEAVGKSRFGWLKPLFFSGVATLAVLAVVFSFTSMNNTGTQASKDTASKTSASKQTQKVATTQPATQAPTNKQATAVSTANKQTANEIDAQINQIASEVSSSYVVNETETNVDDINL